MLNLKDYAFSIELNNYENYKMWLTDVALEAINQVFEDKPMFKLEDVAYMVFDDYLLNTNACSFSPIRIYIALNQPKNINLTEKRTMFKRKKSALIKNLHLPLHEIKNQMFNNIVNLVDNSCLIYNNARNIEIWKTEITEDGTKTSIHFKIIPTFIYEETGEDVIYYAEKDKEVIREDIVNSLCNFNIKNEETNYVYSDVVLIFKNLFLQQENKKELPFLLFETILYNVPSKYFTGTSNAEILNIINFIKNFNIKDFKTIAENDYAFASKTTPFSIFYAKHIIKTIEKSINKLTETK